MSTQLIEQDFKKKVCDQLSIHPEGMERFRVFTPFLLEDGDHLAVVLKKDYGKWVLSDEGHTYMHLTYYDLDERDLQRGTRQKIITNALAAFSVVDREGELMLAIEDEHYGDALYSFVQALLKVSDVTYLSRERARSTFADDFRSFVEHLVPADRRQFDWHDPQRDPEGNYTVDCRINGMATPTFLYALPSDDKIRDATITLLQFERWGIPFQSVGIFEDETEVNRRVLARFSDAVGKIFSTLSGNQDRIRDYLEKLLVQQK